MRPWLDRKTVVLMVALGVTWLGVAISSMRDGAPWWIAPIQLFTGVVLVLGTARQRLAIYRANEAERLFREALEVAKQFSEARQESLTEGNGCLDRPGAGGEV